MTTTSDNPSADLVTRWLVVGEGVSTQDALNKMSEHARAHGAAEIIGVRMAVSGSGFGTWHIAYGTAVNRPTSSG